MGKNQSASNLTNVIQVSSTGNVLFVSGSTTLMSISSSGAITTTGVISGSNALSASYASASTSASYSSNADALANSFVAFSSSILAQTASFNAFSASIYTATSSFSGRVGALESYTASLNLKTASFATTGSNNFTAVQHIADTTNPTGFDTTASLYTEGGFGIKKDTYISSSLYIKGNLTVYGTQSVNYITSSQLNISTNLITVNTATPSVRFGGIAVQDSGSVNGLTGSLLWDSQNNSWLYNNPSGSGNYDSSLVIMGPRNSSTLGNEVGLSCNYLVQGHGHHHTTSSGIFHDGSTTCLPGIATIGSDIILSAANPVIYGGTAVGGVSVSNNTGGSYIKIFGASHATTPNTTAFINANSTVLTINASGNVGIGTATPCSVLHVYGVNPSLIIQNSNTSTVGNTSNIIFRNLLSTGAIHFAGYIAGIQQSTSANTGDLSFNTYDNGIVVEGIRIASNGNVGIGTPTPCTMLHVQGQATIGCSTYRTRIDGSSAGTWISFGTLACNNFLGRTGTFSSAYVIDSNNGNISFRFADVEKAYINSSGQACFLGSITAANFYSAGTTGFWSDAYDVRRNGFYADGTNLIFRAGTSGTGEQTRMVIVQASGKVGIGCTTPQKNLTVDGCIGMSNTYNWGITNDNDANWGFRVCSAGPNYSTFISYAGDQGSDRRGGIYNQNGHWVAYGNCVGNFIVTCNLSVGVNITAGNTITAGGKITASSAQINGSSLTQTQQLINSTGNFANMVHKVFGAAGGFSTSVICVNLQGAGGYGYIINSGGTGGGVFQSGGGYINGPGNFSHSAPVGSGFTVTCHTCAGTDNVIRFVGAGGTHPFVSIQMFGSLNQSIDDNSFYIAYS